MFSKLRLCLMVASIFSLGVSVYSYSTAVRNYNLIRATVGNSTVTTGAGSRIPLARVSFGNGMGNIYDDAYYEAVTASLSGVSTLDNYDVTAEYLKGSNQIAVTVKCKEGYKGSLANITVGGRDKETEDGVTLLHEVFDSGEKEYSAVVDVADNKFYLNEVMVLVKYNSPEGETLGGENLDYGVDSVKLTLPKSI